MPETSELYEEIEPSLLEDSNKYTVIVVDGPSRQQMATYDFESPEYNPFLFDAAPFLPNHTPMTLPRFYEIASQIISDAQDREGIPDEKKVVLVQDYQPEDFHLKGPEVISCRVLKREPAKMNPKGTGRPQRAKGYDYEIRSANYPNKVIVVESRPIDHRIEFACWATTATAANNRALWLEKLFVTHAWMFKVQGTERFYWTERNADTLWKTGEQRLHQRPLTFFVRFREFEVFAHPVIRHITFKVSMNTNP